MNRNQNNDLRAEADQVPQSRQKQANGIQIPL
jgi:hypothetical protein